MRTAQKTARLAAYVSLKTKQFDFLFAPSMSRVTCLLHVEESLGALQSLKSFESSRNWCRFEKNSFE
jgi:hypothetical protein